MNGPSAVTLLHIAANVIKKLSSEDEAIFWRCTEENDSLKGKKLLRGKLKIIGKCSARILKINAPCYISKSIPTVCKSILMYYRYRNEGFWSFN